MAAGVMFRSLQGKVGEVRGRLRREGRTFSALNSGLECRRAIRRRWQADADRHVREDERGATLRRGVWRPAAGPRAGAARSYTAKVAAEMARISPRAEMDLSAVQAIVDEAAAKRQDVSGVVPLGRHDRDHRVRCGSGAPARRFVREAAATNGTQINPALLRCLLVRFRIFHDQPAAGSAT